MQNSFNPKIPPKKGVKTVLLLDYQKQKIETII